MIPPCYFLFLTDDWVKRLAFISESDDFIRWLLRITLSESLHKQTQITNAPNVLTIYCWNLFLMLNFLLTFLNKVWIRFLKCVFCKILLSDDEQKYERSKRKGKTGSIKGTVTKLHGHGGLFFILYLAFLYIKRLITIILVGIIIHANILWQSSHTIHMHIKIKLKW